MFDRRYLNARYSLFELLAVVVLFAVMVTTSFAWIQAKANFRVGEGNRELLCESVRARLAAEAQGDVRLQDVYNRRCR